MSIGGGLRDFAPRRKRKRKCNKSTRKQHSFQPRGDDLSYEELRRDVAMIQRVSMGKVDAVA